MSEGLLTQEQAVSELLAFVFSGAIGSAKGKAVGYSLVAAKPTEFSWWVALEDIDGPDVPLDRYCVKLDRRSRQISPPEPVVLSKEELSDAILSATGQHLASSARFTDGALSISYKVTVQETPDVAYVVQLRHHGNVASMDSLMTLISKTVDSHILPVPPVYPIPGEGRRQQVTGVGRQITRLIPGVVASTTYPHLSHDEKLVLYEKWPSHSRPAGVSRFRSVSSSVREYLQAYIRASIVALEKQEGIQEYKDQYLKRIKDFVNDHMHEIPPIVEDVPIVAMHSDMGPHNIIVSSQTPTDLEAVIDWEFVASAPFASLHRIIEMLFRESAANEFGPEYDRASELREAFWDTIPDWKLWVESEPCRVFLEWFRFGLFMKPEWRPDDLAEEDAREFWRENIRVVEGMLEKYI
ncbi:aminoglycoside 3'-phosphotransferase/choline kinase domain protein [Metarhizium robertsii]|uniref:Aminoglycoside 3'-phosphotransferase/choline kinase domain protein n=1 Tax=Metarhizium robertsii TaxID=568076 RepID=A0A014QVW3_9HYPO|nr:aminoglycoside 3'-phosphotransferase/choline kinase domain protein [Metarhizium robertsii]